MTFMRSQPWQEMTTLRQQLDRLFDDLAPLNRNESSPTQPVWSPAIELKTTDADVILKAALPGIDAKDLEIQVTRGVVSISGTYRHEAKTEANNVFRSEFRYGNFRRVVPLPVEVQNDRVTADFQAGILTLTLPKVVADRNQVVKINLVPESAPAEVSSDQAQPAPAQPAPQPEDTQSEDVWAE